MKLRHVLLALAVGCGTQPAKPATPTVGPGVYRTHVGSAEVTVVSDGVFSLDIAHGLAIGATPEQIAHSPIEASFNEFVIASHGHLALIDTGAAGNMGPTAGKLQQSLTNAGIRPENITDVFLTHVHPDHTGGLVVAGKPAFPNATIHLDANDLAYWTDAKRASEATGMAAQFFAAARASLEPNTAKLQTFTGATTFFPGFRAEPAYGHTPGHVAYVLESDGQTLEFLGDIIHIPSVQFADPHVAVAFDVDPAAAVATRERILGEVANNKILVANNHSQFPGLGHVDRAGTTFHWSPAK